MFQKDTLHHAYFIQGEKIAALAAVESFLSDAFNIVRQGNPDIHYADHESFGIDESRALQDMQSMRPIRGDRKIFIVSIGSMTGEAQNSLLKVFEEPTPGTHFFIIASSESILLPTLRSRMIVVTHESSNERGQDIVKMAKTFIISSPKERLGMVADMIEEKDKAGAEAFLVTLVSELRAKNLAKYAGAIKEILSLAKYLKDRSPSLKLILERIALLSY